MSARLHLIEGYGAGEAPDARRRRRAAASFARNEQMERLAAFSAAGHRLSASQRISLGLYLDMKRAAEDEEADDGDDDDVA